MCTKGKINDRSLVAGLGIAPSLGDYEPPVQLYTTPRQLMLRDYSSLVEANAKLV